MHDFLKRIVQPGLTSDSDLNRRAANVVLVMPAAADVRMPEKFDGEIIFQSARGDHAMRLTSTGFYVTIAGIETRCEDPQNIYQAMASFLLSRTP